MQMVYLETTLHNLTHIYFSWQAMMGYNSSQLHNNSMSLLVVLCCPVASRRLLLSRRDIVGFHPTFSRHGIVQASLTLLIWLNENVVLCCGVLFPTQFVTLLADGVL